MDLYGLIKLHTPPWSLREMLVVGVVILLVAVTGITLAVRGKIHRSQAVAVILFVCFMAIVYGSTVFGRMPGERRSLPEVFWSWKIVFGIGDARQRYGVLPWEMLKENLLNLLLLMPAGFLLPFMRKKRTRCFSGLLFGAVLSASIEVSQYLLGRGLFEWDDLIHNAVGCMLGCMIGAALWAAVQQKGDAKRPVKKEDANRPAKNG